MELKFNVKIFQLWSFEHFVIRQLTTATADFLTFDFWKFQNFKVICTQDASTYLDGFNGFWEFKPYIFNKKCASYFSRTLKYKINTFWIGWNHIGKWWNFHSSGRKTVFEKKSKVAWSLDVISHHRSLFQYSGKWRGR